MDQKTPVVITISRQFGSGGADIGQSLAARLNYLYMDREIVTKTAKKFFTTPDKIKSIEERKNLTGVILPTLFSYTPTSEEVFETQSKIIKDMARRQSVVIVGRAGNNIFGKSPNHVSIYLHADLRWRQGRVQEIYNLEGIEALKLIETTDKNRLKYVRTFTKQDISDARQYDLCIDTSVVGLQGAEEIILAYLKVRFGI